MLPDYLFVYLQDEDIRRCLCKLMKYIMTETLTVSVQIDWVGRGRKMRFYIKTTFWEMLLLS